MRVKSSRRNSVRHTYVPRRGLWMTRASLPYDVCDQRAAGVMQRNAEGLRSASGAVCRQRERERSSGAGATQQRGERGRERERVMREKADLGRKREAEKGEGALLGAVSFPCLWRSVAVVASGLELSTSPETRPPVPLCSVGVPPSLCFSLAFASHPCSPAVSGEPEGNTNLSLACSDVTLATYHLSADAAADLVVQQWR